jgi:XTP/dITP diphosphohydrolase
MVQWILNTNSPGKMKEFQRLFACHGIVLIGRKTDLPEIDADPVTVVVHKASQLEEGILVEDTSLQIQGANVGVHIRWLLEQLPQYIGRRAIWRVLLAKMDHGSVYVYEGVVQGTIVPPRGDGGFGFDPYFLPDNAVSTLADDKPDSVNARAKAVDALIQGKPFAILHPITNWSGPWQ